MHCDRSMDSDATNESIESCDQRKREKHIKRGRNLKDIDMMKHSKTSLPQLRAAGPRWCAPGYQQIAEGGRRRLLRCAKVAGKPTANSEGGSQCCEARIEKVKCLSKILGRVVQG